MKKAFDYGEMEKRVVTWLCVLKKAMADSDNPTSYKIAKRLGYAGNQFDKKRIQEFINDLEHGPL